MTELSDVRSLEQLWWMAVTWIPHIVAAFGVAAAIWLLYRLTRPALRRVLEHANFEPVLVRLLVDQIYRFSLMAVALVMALGQLGINVGAAVAGIGVVGIAIGFAAQDSLANTIAGFMIFWDKPFLLGDFVTVAGEYGRISNITLRSTRIRTNRNTFVVIPNRKIIDEVLVNHSKHGETRVEVPIGIAYKESIPRAREVILAAVRHLPNVVPSPAPDVVAAGLGDSSVNLLVRVWIAEADKEQPVAFAVLEAAKLALDTAGIEIPFPHLQLFVDTVEERVWQGASRLARRPADGQAAS